MSEFMSFEPTEEQFGPFWKYICEPDVTDIDYLRILRKGNTVQKRKLQTAF